MEFGHAVLARRMRRAFSPEPVSRELLDHALDLARRAPSAGNAQGVDFVVLEGPEQTGLFWDVTLPEPDRSGFRWRQLLDAPVIVVPVANRSAYLARYQEPDKVAAGLGVATSWPVPYWLIDTAFATMVLLLAVTDAGLGALFFGVFRDGERLVRELGIPDGHQLIGAVALGHPRPDHPGRSSARPRRPLDEVVHRGRW